MLGIQLYSLRREAEGPSGSVESMLAAVPGLGFDAVELYKTWDWSDGEWRDRLDALGLGVAGRHVVLETLETSLDEVASSMRTLGSDRLVVPVPPEDGKGRSRYERCAARLNSVADQAQGLGMRVSYHNHHWEFEAFDDGGCGMEVLLEQTDPATVGFQVDTAWMTFGGWDVVRFLESRADRVHSIHAKEVRAADKSEPRMGQGDVDFPQVVRLAMERDWPLIVEYESEDALDGTRAAAAYLSRLMAGGEAAP